MLCHSLKSMVLVIFHHVCLFYFGISWLVVSEWQSTVESFAIIALGLLWKLKDCWFGSSLSAFAFRSCRHYLDSDLAIDFCVESWRLSVQNFHAELLWLRNQLFILHHRSLFFGSFVEITERKIIVICCWSDWYLSTVMARGKIVATAVTLKR